LGNRLVLVVPRRPARASRRERRRAGAHRQQAGAGPRITAVAEAASASKSAGAVRDVFRRDLWLVLLPDLAADVLAGGTRVQSEIGRLAGEPAAGWHRDWRIPWRPCE